MALVAARTVSICDASLRTTQNRLPLRRCRSWRAMASSIQRRRVRLSQNSVLTRRSGTRRYPERPGDNLIGAVVVDKPQGWTSHDVVNKVRRLAGTRKVGHL